MQPQLAGNIHTSANDFNFFLIFKQPQVYLLVNSITIQKDTWGNMTANNPSVAKARHSIHRLSLNVICMTLIAVNVNLCSKRRTCLSMQKHPPKAGCGHAIVISTYMHSAVDVKDM